MTTLPEKQISLWDCDDPADPKIGYFYSWNGYSEDFFRRSLLRYVDVHGERLRTKYSALIFDMGLFRVNGKSIIDHLRVKKNFSYWWMTLHVEKSVWKSPSIKDAIRLLALEEIIIERRPEKVILYSSDNRLHIVISKLCLNLGVLYERDRLNIEKKAPLSFKNIYALLPRPVRGLLYLSWYIATRLRFVVDKKNTAFFNENSVFFCSYFDNLDEKKIQSGTFRSNYWGEIGALVAQLAVSQNWLHHYIPCRITPTPGAANKLVRLFNKNSERREFHTFLESYLSLSVVLRVMMCWGRLLISSWRLRNIDNICVSPNSKLNLWPILSDDWYSSMRGAVSIDNLLMIELFDEAMGDMPNQKQGFYLCENQAWERAFVHFWYQHKHGQLVAVPHSTRSFWDLRFHCDKRLFSNSVFLKPELPEFYAVNGLSAKKHFLSENYPGNILLECEALRYSYLGGIPKRRSIAAEHRDVINLLILGDYTDLTTSKMLQMLEKLANYLSCTIKMHFKPHPGCSLNLQNIAIPNFTVIDGSLSEIITNYDVAFSSSSTSAAVEAHVSGLPLAIMLDDSNLNLSPLWGSHEISFVSDSKELARVIEIRITRAINNLPFFYIDSDYSRWKKIILNCASKLPTASDNVA
jgi:surface carbohydrate biosynthesis protein (TIGR04326 family)